MLIETLIFLVILSTIFETIDSGLGMMYGTLLSPFLIMLGFATADVIPSILISQAIGGSLGAIFHHKEGNSDFSSLKNELGLVLIILFSSIIASLLGVLFANYISNTILKLYISSLALIMGLICISGISYNFDKLNMTIIGIAASFNKSSTGGGFGPLCSTGLIVGGIKSKQSIAITTLCEVPLCIFAFIMYIVLNRLPDLQIMSSLIIGAIIGGRLGPILTAKIDTNKLRTLVGILAILSGLTILGKIVYPYLLKFMV